MLGRLLALAALLSACLSAAVSVSGPTTLRGTVGVPLVAAISATGGAPLTYNVVGKPTWLTIDPGSGWITGTPDAAATTLVTLTANGGSGGSAGTGSTTMTITIDLASGPSVVNAAAWSVSDGSQCSLQLVPDATATGFAANGQPGGLALSVSGLLAGTATVPGRYNVTVSADGGTTWTTLLLEVLTAQSGAPLFTVPVQPLAAEGATFASFPTATGATAFAATDLPAWLTIDGGDGLITGTPPVGTASANLRLTASLGGAAATTVLAVPVAVPGAGDPLPLSPPVIEATAGSGLGWKAASDVAATWSAVGLPTGLTLDAASGQLTGSPVAAGNASAVITATPALPELPVASTIAIRVRPAATGAPVLSTLAPPVLTVGAPAAIAVATSGVAPTSYAATGASDFTIDSDGLLTGTPTAAGLTAVTLSASNASGTAVATLLLQTGVRIAAAPLPTAPVAFHATAGSRFAAALAADAPVTSWSESGLPGTLALAPFTGRITGLPAAGVSNVFLSASNAVGSNPTHGTIRALAATVGAPVIANAGPWLVGAGQPVRLQLDPGGGATWTISGLPSGLAADASGLISGVTAVTGDATLDLTAASGAAQARTAGLLVVEPVIAGAPVFSDPGLLLGVVGVPFSAQLLASNTPIEFTISGGPIWLSVVPATGGLGGTPTAAGDWLLAITARNAPGTVRSYCALRIDPAPVPPVTPPAPSPPVSNLSGGGCGAGGAGLILAMVAAMGLTAGSRRRVRWLGPPPRSTHRR